MLESKMRVEEMAPRALTTSEAARRLGVSESLLEKLRVFSPDKSPPFMRIGRAIRYRTSDLDAWAAARVEGGR